MFSERRLVEMGVHYESARTHVCKVKYTVSTLNRTYFSWVSHFLAEVKHGPRVIPHLQHDLVKWIKMIPY